MFKRRTPRNVPRTVAKPEYETTIDKCVEWTKSFPDPDSRGLAAGWLNDLLLDAIVELGMVQRQAVREMRAEGRTCAEVGFTLGLSRQRIDQMTAS